MAMPGITARADRPGFFRRAIARLTRMWTWSRHVDWSDKATDSPLYAVGDIHGMAGLLDAMLLKIEADAASLGVPSRIIFLGDIINRGPDSRAVVERLVNGPSRRGDEWLVLCGNHEQALLDALQSDSKFEKFLSRGAKTLRSYGLPRDAMTRKSLRAALPAAHRTFFERLPLTCRTKTHLFVHAGLLPGKPLEDQSSRDLLTIRERFFEKAHTLPLTVVHGHTPSDGKPVIAEKRICIDTGAHETGILTAVIIQTGKKPRFLQVHAQ